MKIWIDLANAPHVPFFVPIIKELEKRNVDLVITARDYNQTDELAKMAGLNFTVVGKHGGKTTLGKAVNLPVRVGQLMRFARTENPGVALSHNSYTHSIAGRLSGCQVVTIMDYEGQPANHIAFRFAHKVIVPNCFPVQALKKFGAKEKKVFTYDGFKEQIYLEDFNPDPDFHSLLKKLHNFPSSYHPSDSVLITVRTPATMAVYHNFQNKLFDLLLKKISLLHNTICIVLCRSREQREQYKSRFQKLFFPDHPLPGKDLVYYSDYVFSAGGTMNREAAIIGTTVYTLFGGALPAVDQKLIELGRMKCLNCPEDIEQLVIEKQMKKDIYTNKTIIDKILSVLLGQF